MAGIIWNEKTSLEEGVRRAVAVFERKLGRPAMVVMVHRSRVSEEQTVQVDGRAVKVKPVRFVLLNDYFVE
jgi:hypothetical protein